MNRRKWACLAVVAFVAYRIIRKRLYNNAISGRDVRVITANEGILGQQSRALVDKMPSINGEDPYMPTLWALNKWVN